MPDIPPPHNYVPDGPVEYAPCGPRQPEEARRQALNAVLGGVPLGDYGEQVIGWAAELNDPECKTLARIMWDCRLTGLPEPGTVTEWAIAYTHTPSLGLSPRRVIQPYPDEDRARGAVAELRRLGPEDEPAVMYREVGPWKEAKDA